MGSLRERIAALADAADPCGSVTLTTAFLKGLVAEDTSGVKARPHGEPLIDLTVDEVGKLLGRSAGTVRNWCNGGELKGAYKLNGREWRIPRGAVEALQRRQREASAPPDLGAEEVDDDELDLSAWRRLGSG